MAITYEDMAQPLVPNTKMQKVISNGAHNVYTLRPVDGYVLHDNEADETEHDPFTQEPTGRIIFRYSSGMCSCGANYDFTPITVTDENGVSHTAYGSREFFARPQTEVPENQF